MQLLGILAQAFALYISRCSNHLIDTGSASIPRLQRAREPLQPPIRSEKRTALLLTSAPRGGVRRGLIRLKARGVRARTRPNPGDKSSACFLSRALKLLSQETPLPTASGGARHRHTCTPVPDNTRVSFSGLIIMMTEKQIFLSKFVSIFLI